MKGIRAGIGEPCLLYGKQENKQKRQAKYPSQALKEERAVCDEWCSHFHVYYRKKKSTTSFPPIKAKIRTGTTFSLAGPSPWHCKIQRGHINTRSS